MILLFVLSIIAVCCGQEATDYIKLDSGNEVKVQKQQESIEALMRQVANMGLLLENYRRVILSGITEASDVCGFIEKLSDLNGSDDRMPEDIDDMGIRLYRTFFRKLQDPIMKSQMFSALESQVEVCFSSGQHNQVVEKRDKSQIQKVRFHSWGGKRNRGAPKVVIRTPFHAWGGKRSGNV